MKFGNSGSGLNKYIVTTFNYDPPGGRNNFFISISFGCPPISIGGFYCPFLTKVAKSYLHREFQSYTQCRVKRPLANRQGLG